MAHNPTITFEPSTTEPGGTIEAVIGGLGEQYDARVTRRSDGQEMAASIAVVESDIGLAGDEGTVYVFEMPEWDVVQTAPDRFDCTAPV